MGRETVRPGPENPGEEGQDGEA
ncbi:uncharacterized protein G2W53_034232 [Senna tora]|uniref:Uncharacterized protein n=1 Tax=Senna tora TaxID=362788 RepID=A0A834T2U2_9FABA|nr:uncharacterized protein G2W53_034232 [Senna tora]